jgi:hypothetical protein
MEKQKRKVKVNPVDIVITKYETAGWKCFKCPGENINDIIAHHGKRLHHVRVVPEDDRDNLKFVGESKNAFIQNAFSNAATPVYAHFKLDGKIALEDINTNSRVVVAKSKAKTGAATGASSATNPVSDTTMQPTKKNKNELKTT